MKTTHKIISIVLVAILAITGVSFGDTTGSIRDGQDGSSGRTARQKTTYNSSTVHVPHVNLDSTPLAATNIHVPAANTAAVVTYAAVSGKKHVITGIAYSYGGAGTLSGGNLKIEDVSGTTVFSQDIAAKGPGTIVFPSPVRAAAVNTALIITLAAGGANVDGKVNVLNYSTE